MLDLFEEFRLLAAELRTAAVNYALCGGLAVAVHGIVRATEDIDLLVPESELPHLRAWLERRGFRFPARPLLFQNDTIRIHRLVKASPDTEDFVVIDLLLVTPVLAGAWATRVLVPTEFGEIWVLRPRRLFNSRNCGAVPRTWTTSRNSVLCRVETEFPPPDMSAAAITRRLRRVSQLNRLCRALAGPRWRPKHILPATQPGAPAPEQPAPNSPADDPRVR